VHLAGCFYRLMQALSDDQHIAAIEAKVDRLEKKIDEGFADMRTQIVSSERALRVEIDSVRGEVVAVRNDTRSDFRTALAVVVGMWVATVLAVVEFLLNHS
jgi:hypothetical protein